MVKKTVAVAGVAFTLLLVGALTGCSAAGVLNHVASSAPTAAPPVNFNRLAVGAAVGASTASAINAKGGDTHAYKLPNGTYVVIKKDEPLPPAVQNDVNNVANAAPNDASTNGGLNNTNDGHAIQGTIEFSTGKNVAVIQHGTVSPWGSTTQYDGYVGLASFYSASNPAPVSQSEAAVQAQVQAEINKQSDPASWIIVVNN